MLLLLATPIAIVCFISDIPVHFLPFNATATASALTHLLIYLSFLCFVCCLLFVLHFVLAYSLLISFSRLSVESRKSWRGGGSASASQAAGSPCCNTIHSQLLFLGSVIYCRRKFQEICADARVYMDE